MKDRECIKTYAHNNGLYKCVCVCVINSVLTISLDFAANSKANPQTA